LPFFTLTLKNYELGQSLKSKFGNAERPEEPEINISTVEAIL
jgi:hypothetical protein